VSDITFSTYDVANRYLHIEHNGKKLDHAPVWSVGRVLISLSVAVKPVGG